MSWGGFVVVDRLAPDEKVPGTEDEHGRCTWRTAVGEVTVFEDGDIHIDAQYRSDVAQDDANRFAAALITAAMYAGTLKGET